MTTRVRLDRISSATRNAKLDRHVLVGSDIVSEEGYILAVRILNDKAVYNHVEDPDGRMVPLRTGDILAGVLGNRRALRGYAGAVPDSLAVGDRINVLNLGGVLGTCSSQNADIGPPFEAEVLGAILAFPKTGDRIGTPAHIRSGSLKPAKSLDGSVPIVYIVGTSMDSGKTVAASEIVRGLSRTGLKVGGLKLTGVSLRRDVLSMLDAGAAMAATFNDVGIVSTSNAVVVPTAKGLVNHLIRHARPDVIVAELGDGIFGEYGVSELLKDHELMNLSAALVVCAPDQVGSWGAVKVLRDRFGLAPAVITGPATDNEVGKKFVTHELNIPALNARRDTEELVGLVLELVQRARV